MADDDFGGQPDVNRVAAKASLAFGGDDAAKKDPTSPNLNTDSAAVAPPAAVEPPPAQEAPASEPEKAEPPAPSAFDAAFSKYQQSKTDTKAPRVLRMRSRCTGSQRMVSRLKTW